MPVQDDVSGENENNESEHLRIALTHAMFHNDVTRIKCLLQNISEVGCEPQLEAEVSSAGLLLGRLEKHREESLKDLNKYLCSYALTELGRLLRPPVLVQQLITATLLLLGVKEEQAKDWAYFKMKFTKGGRESLLREILKLDIETIPADVAQRAKEVIADMSEERVKCVSLAGAGLYTWVFNTINVILTDSDGGKSKRNDRHVTLQP